MRLEQFARPRPDLALLLPPTLPATCSLDQSLPRNARRRAADWALAGARWRRCGQFRLGFSLGERTRKKCTLRPR